MSTFALFVAMLAPAIFVAAALAQTQLPPPAGRSSPPPGATTPAPESENAVEGRIENIDPSSRRDQLRAVTQGYRRPRGIDILDSALDRDNPE